MTKTAKIICDSAISLVVGAGIGSGIQAIRIAIKKKKLAELEEERKHLEEEEAIAKERLEEVKAQMEAARLEAQPEWDRMRGLISRAQLICDQIESEES